MSNLQIVGVWANATTIEAGGARLYFESRLRFERMTMTGKRTILRAVIVVVVLGAIGCGSPTSPSSSSSCGTTAVFAQESFYRERAEPEQEFSGPLEWRNAPATPNGRDHRYFLNGVPVYSGGTTTEPKFRAAIGAQVAIRGKVVDVGFGPEIWSASLTACR
jgi:hypothetical protein